MNNPSTALSSPTADNLRNLLLIRSIALLGQTAVLAWVLLSGQAPQGLVGVAASLVLLALLTGISLWRTTRPWPVADTEFLAQLVIDVAGWTVLMYFTGGANNPFISYYTVPLVISAAVLPGRYTWLVAGASVAAYSLMLSVYRPFPLFTPHAAMGHAGEGASVHILGMWFNFLFSAGLITYFVVRMAATLRQQEARAAARREDRLRNDQILAVAGLAAGTAHELGTPLATMTVLLDEMLADDALPEYARRDCRLLQEQLQETRATLGRLSETAQLTSIEQTRRQGAGDFAREVLARWAVRRPGTAYEFTCHGSGPQIEVEPTLAQALENLLNNAADSGSDRIEMSLDWDSQTVHIVVRDHGPGISPEQAEQLGKPFIHSSGNGLGIGLLLSQAAVERAGGRIELRNTGDGTLATLSLPIASGEQ